MNMNNTIKRLLSLAFLTLAASLMLQGCADGPDAGSGNSGGTSSGNSGGASGGATSGASGGTTSGITGGQICQPGDTAQTCPTIAAYYPVVTVLVDNKANEAVATGQAVQLTWTAVNGSADPNATDAITCIASGAWSGPEPVSGSESVTQNIAGTYTYVLTCTNSYGPGVGDATLTVTGPNTNNPSYFPVVTITVDGKPSETVEPGTPVNLQWSTNNSGDPTLNDPVSCTASGAWSDTRAPAGMLTISQTLPTAYPYTLTCTNSYGSGASTAVLNIDGTCAPGDKKCSTYYGYVNCPALVPGTVFKPFAAPAASASTATSGLCLVCSVQDANNVVDTTTTAPAMIELSVGAVVADESLSVGPSGTTTPVTYPANTPVGFVIGIPSAPVLNLGLLQNIALTATLQGTDVATSASGSSPTVALDLLGLLNPGRVQAVVYEPTTPFDGVRIDVSGVVNALTEVDAYAAGVCVAPDSSTTSTTSGGSSGGSSGGTSGGSTGGTSGGTTTGGSTGGT